MKRLLAIFILLTALPLAAQMVLTGASRVSGAAQLTCSTTGTPLPVFSPAPGTYSSTQNVTITCGSGLTPFYTVNGESPTIASTKYTAPVSVSANTTIQAICATAGSINQNVAATSAGWKCVTPNAQTYGSLSCQAGGGVGSIQPSNVTMSWGSTANFGLSTTSSTSETQTLFVYTGPGCDNCTELVEDKWIEPTQGSTFIANNEADIYQFDHTRGIEHMAGLQCNQQAGTLQWQVDSGDGTGWHNTGVTAACPLPTTSYTHVELKTHWINGDTGCTGGHGCLTYDWLRINGTQYNLNLSYGNGTTSFSSIVGNQDQIDLTNTTTSGQNPTTAARNLQLDNVSAGYGDESAVASGTYIISGVGTATPVLGPFVIANMTGDNANYNPTSPTTGSWTGCAGTNPCLTFGKQGTGTASMAVPITISNCANGNIAACSGSGSLTVTSMAITGANASDFTLSGTCGTIASGSDCEPSITFTPSQPSGTNEAATLTVSYSGATYTNQSMSLTGTSATVTQISSCQSLNANTNYQLTQNVSAAGSCFLNNAANVDLNLNGFTVTYCTAGGTSLVGGVFVNGFNEKSMTLHNGTITEASGKTCTGVTSDNGGQGSSDFMISSAGSSSQGYGNTFFNLTLSQNDSPGHAIYEEYAGVSTTLFSTIHDVGYVMNGATACGSVSCRADNQSYAMDADGSAFAAPFVIYNVGGTGGVQGGLSYSSPGSSISYNLISPGSTVTTNTNGYVLQVVSKNSTVSNNVTTGSGTGGSCLSCRGIQVGAFNGSAVTGIMVKNNRLFSTYLNNNTEYGGCPLGGAYGMQLNTGGSGIDLSNNTFENNWVVTTAKTCPSVGFSFSNATNGSGPNKTIDNHFECDIATGATNYYPCDGMQFIQKEYSPYPDGSLISTGDTILGDTSALYIGYNGTGSWTCNQCTFGKGTNPVSSGWVFLDIDGGLSSGASSSEFKLVDPTFIDGAAASQSNLATWAINNSTLSFDYLIQWTYTVTAEQSSNSAPISGATVTIKDVNNTTECSGTTNASGVFSCVVNDTKYSAASGSYTTPSFNPTAISISASGCTTLNYSDTITSTTTEIKKLSGC